MYLQMSVHVLRRKMSFKTHVTGNHNKLYFHGLSQRVHKELNSL